MDLHGGWEATLADDDLRRTWLDDPAPVPVATDVDPAEATDGDADDGLERRSATQPAWHSVAVPGHWRSEAAFDAEDGPLLYRTRFEHAPPEDDDRWWLTFDGIFYQGDVWLDGTYVGDTEGYFFPHTFEVTDHLRDRRDHVLGVEVTCSPARDRTAKRSITGSFQHAEGLPPDANPGGIWRPVRLERTGPIRIRHLRVVCREANETRATVLFRAVLDACVSTEVLLRSAVGDTELVEERRLAAGENQVEWQMRVSDPELWWPHALGEPVLHDVVVEVGLAPQPGTDEAGASAANAADVDPVADADAAADADADEGQGDAQADIAVEGDDEDPMPSTEGWTVSHRLTRRIGLRQIHLRAWVLHVNGERLFVKGADQLPARLHLAEATPEELRSDVQLAKDANLDLIRLHSHITRPEVYEAADELGMLIWQDFPLHRGYARSVRKQAQRQAREAVDVLAHHPSIVIWCGHDEPFTVEDEPGDAIDQTLFNTKRFAAQELPSWNKAVLDRTVKRTIEKNDPSRPVIAHSGVLPHPPKFDGTDTHLGFGWFHGESRDLGGLARAVPRVVRFVSEFGAQAVPDTDEFCGTERWPDLDWERLTTEHGYRADVFDLRVPPVDHPTFDSWRRATQGYQAELIAQQVETLRRLKYRPTGGFALFSLADGWPAIGWSVVDHERRPKAGYAALREACRPVIVAADRFPAEVLVGEAIALDVHVVSDLRSAVDSVEIGARLTWEGGEQRWRFGGDVPADSCIRVGTLPIEVPDAPGPMTLELTLTGTDAIGGPVHRTDRTHIVSA
jgi:beta-mannosidase